MGSVADEDAGVGEKCDDTEPLDVEADITKVAGSLIVEQLLEPERRFELLTCALRVRCSTD